MLYPAHWFVVAFVGVLVLFWVGLMVWAGRTGLFNKNSESVKYKVFEDDYDGGGELGCGPARSSSDR